MALNLRPAGFKFLPSFCTLFVRNVNFYSFYYILYIILYFLIVIYKF